MLDERVDNKKILSDEARKEIIKDPGSWATARLRVVGPVRVSFAALAQVRLALRDVLWRRDPRYFFTPLCEPSERDPVQVVRQHRGNVLEVRQAAEEIEVLAGLRLERL